MKKACISLLSVCLLLTATVSKGQTFEVSDPGLSLIDNTVHITYDILNSSQSDNFLVTITITDSDGNTIEASAFSGDIGDGVSGGGGKVIQWDLAADGIVMNSTIYVKIRTKLIPPPKSDIPVREEPVIVEDRKESPAIKETPATAISESFSRRSIMLKSLALPGMGLTHVTGKPHWIKGVAGYSCLVGSVMWNRKAISSYRGIYDLTDYDEKDEQLKKSVNEDNLSETLAYVAIGIWVADLVWTWVGTKELEEKPFLSEGNGISLKTNMDPLTRTPLIGVMYRF